jgi:hypothetical protein
MNKAGLERNENIFRFTNPKGRLRSRLGEAVRWATLVRMAEAGHIAGERPVKGSGFTCRTAMNFSNAAITGFFKDLLQLIDSQQFFVHRMFPCGADACEPARDPGHE